MSKYYSMQDVSCAKVILSMHGKTDRFGNELVNLFYVLWAIRVMIWFSNYLCKVKELVKRVHITWNKAVSDVWRRIRQKTLRIKDTP